MIAAWMSPNEEARSLRVAAARASCRVDSCGVVETPAGRRVVAQVMCRNGWDAAKMLLSLVVADARTEGARALAAQIRAANAATTAGAFARAVQRYVLEHVRFAREVGELFTGASYTLATAIGDCDDHARVTFALLAAGGVPARLAFLYKPSTTGPSHVVAQAYVDGSWRWVETTIPAAFDEHPYTAAIRLGVIGERADMAKEVIFMSESDLPPVPADFLAHNPASQVAADAQALARLGFLGCTMPYAGTAADPSFRQAVADFQAAHRDAGDIDGLIGTDTRKALARAMGALGPSSDGFVYSATQPQKLFTHAQARECLRRAFPKITGRAATENELDFGAAVALGETGYGRAGAVALGAQPGQFAKWASEGRFNWGALEHGTPPCPAGTQLYRGHYPNIPGTPATMGAGKDAGRPVCFFLFDSDDLAAEAFLRAWGAPDTLEAAQTGSAVAVSASMKRHGYYEGFHRPPGGITGSYTSPPFVEEASAEEAERKNIADYAALISRNVNAVRKGGGVLDPSPAAIVRAAGAVATVAIFFGVASAAAWYVAERFT